MSKKILVIGSSWMLASDFTPLAKKSNYEVAWVDRDICNITHLTHVQKTISETKPDFIINLSAYTDVESAEDSGKKANYLVNTIWVWHIAKVAKEFKIPFLTISTDYVFDGEKEEWYSPEDEPNPINEYGLAKYMGERLARTEYPESIIVRTSWLYGWGKNFKNFVNTMLRLSGTRDTLRVVDDQYGSPTSTITLSESILNILQNIEKYKGTILHITDTTEWKGISWYEFATEIMKIAVRKTAVVPCSSEEYPMKAKRPKWSKLINTTNIKNPIWKQSLAQYISNNQ